MVHPADKQLAAWARIKGHLDAGRLNLILGVDGQIIAHNPMGTPLPKNDNIQLDLGALQPYFRSVNDKLRPGQYNDSHVLAGLSDNQDFLSKLWETEIPGAEKLIIKKSFESTGIYRELTIEHFLGGLCAMDYLTLSIDEVDSKEQRFINIGVAYDPKTPPLRMALGSGNYLYFRCPWDPLEAKGFKNFEIIESVFRSVYGMGFRQYHNQVNVLYKDIARKQLVDLVLRETG